MVIYYYLFFVIFYSCRLWYYISLANWLLSWLKLNGYYAALKKHICFVFFAFLCFCIFCFFTPFLSCVLCIFDIGFIVLCVLFYVMMEILFFFFCFFLCFVWRRGYIWYTYISWILVMVGWYVGMICYGSDTIIQYLYCDMLWIWWIFYMKWRKREREKLCWISKLVRDRKIKITMANH